MQPPVARFKEIITFRRKWQLVPSPKRKRLQPLGLRTGIAALPQVHRLAGRPEQAPKVQGFLRRRISQAILTSPRGQGCLTRRL